MKIFLRYSAAITCMIFYLSSTSDARTTEKIVGSVVAGETGYEIPVEVVNNNEEPISEVSAKVQFTPKGLINFNITPKTVSSIPPGESSVFIVSFDVADDAEPMDQAEIVLSVAAPGAVFDNPSPRIAVKIIKKEKPEKEDKHRAATPVLKLVKITGPSPGHHEPGYSEHFDVVYTDGEAGFSASNTDRYTNPKWIGAFRITAAPLEITLGQPFEIAVDIKKRTIFKAGEYCYREVDDGFKYSGDIFSTFKDRTRLSPRIIFDMGNVKAICKEDLHAYCRSNDPTIMEGRILDRLVEKDGTISLQVIFTPEKAETSHGVIYTTSKYHYRLSFQTGGRLDPYANLSAIRNDYVIEFNRKTDNGNLHPDEKSSVIALFMPAFNMDGPGMILHYDVIHQGAPHITSLPDYTWPAELLRPPKDGKERTEDVQGDETVNDDRGGSDSLGQGDRSVAVAAEKLNPDNRNVAALIREWISVAEPPENAIEGAHFRYEQWGRMVGNTADGAIVTATGKPDYALASPEKTVWSMRKKLDSVNHCTVEEYVVSKLRNRSLDNCSGRYKASEAALLDKLTGLTLSDAKAKLEQAGLKPLLSAGRPAPSKQDEGTIAFQDPGPGTKLKRGNQVKLVIYGPYNPKVVVPEIAGLAVKDAKAELEAKGLKVNLVASDLAPTDNLSFKVKEVEPKAGDAVAPGTEVTLKVYGKYNPPLVTVPSVEGLSFAEAKTLLSRAGFKVSAKAAGPAPSEDKSEKIQSQEPAIGAKVNPGSEVTIKVYSRYNVPLVIVPGVEGLSLPDAKARLTQSGFKVSAKSAGPASSKDKSDMIKSQQPAAGVKVKPDSEIEVWVFGKYLPTKEEQVAALDCSQYPGSRAYWDNAAGRPLCGCFDGMMWNSEKSRCISADAYAAEQCSRAYSGSIAQGRTPDGKINCVCPQGTVWNNERTQCVRQLSPQEVCARDYPGTIAQGLTADGKINCICPQGTILNNDRTRCIQQSTGGGNKKQQECSWKLTQIQMFMNNYKANPSNTFQKQMAENIAKEASDYGCDQSAINAALGVSGSGGHSDGNDDCPCVDEQGRRYRMALGLNCGQQGAWRDYNCPNSTGGRSQPPTGAGTGAGSGGGNQNQSACYIDVQENIHNHKYFFVIVWTYETTPGRRQTVYRVVSNRDERYYGGGTFYGPYRSQAEAVRKARELCPNGKIVGKGYSY